MIKTYTGLKALVAFVVLAGAFFLLVSIFFWGLTLVLTILLPLLIAVAYLIIAVFVAVILPATFVARLRPALAVYAREFSGILTGLAWLVLIGVFLKHDWPLIWHPVFWMAFIYTMKFYSRWLQKTNPPPRIKGEVIDIEAREVDGPRR